MANEAGQQTEMEGGREAKSPSARRRRPLWLLLALAIATAGLLLHRDWLFLVGFIVFLVAFVTGGGV